MLGNLILTPSEDSQQLFSRSKVILKFKFKSNLCSSNQMLLRSFRGFQNKDFFQTADQYVYKQQYFCPGFFVDLYLRKIPRAYLSSMEVKQRS